MKSSFTKKPSKPAKRGSKRDGQAAKSSSEGTDLRRKSTNRNNPSRDNPSVEGRSRSTVERSTKFSNSGRKTTERTERSTKSEDLRRKTSARPSRFGESGRKITERAAKSDDRVDKIYDSRARAGNFRTASSVKNNRYNRDNEQLAKVERRQSGQVERRQSGQIDRRHNDQVERKLSDHVERNQQAVHNKVEHILIEANAAGQRLDNFLVTYLKGVPKTRIYRIVRKGEVRVNKGRAQPQYRLNAGDSIRIPPLRRSDPLEYNAQFDNVDAKLRSNILSAILYEDDALLILNKPSGLASHGGSGLSFGAIELLRFLKPNLRSLELVHRLDRDTSGCLVLAKNRKTLVAIQEQLKSGQVEKRYLALVKGQWRGGEVVDVPLKKNVLQSGERMVKVHPEGQPSRTEFSVMERFPLASLMVAKPITGRTHQIRVHAAYAGNPVAGDLKYTDEGFNKEMKSFGLKRLFLHAERISFLLPETGQSVTFEAPMDAALSEVLQKLRDNA